MVQRRHDAIDRGHGHRLLLRHGHQRLGVCSATSAATDGDGQTPPPPFSNSPQSATIPKNTTRLLTVTASGNGTLTYQWYRGTSGTRPTRSAVLLRPATPRHCHVARYVLGTGDGSCGTVNSATSTITAN